MMVLVRRCSFSDGCRSKVAKKKREAFERPRKIELRSLNDNNTYVGHVEGRTELDMARRFHPPTAGPMR